ncbi:PREDICTED: hybrid signal transduction protein dokA isoform X1 [Polistes canadensis]|uniref:hybrid signal transduction protein dokA isoform X1 n=1 Tax=Polistes canadensis TaxID=91411 RepID=UPI000718C3AA|nr:PREDICTED: hybrid signal transduction protein dokA isoform X1 [Polistes canadensis]
MPLSIGVNLRVTGHCNQGGRKYMEDMFSVAYQQTPDDKDLEYAFFGIFDGHGGGEAAAFAKEHLMDIIVKQKNFWSDRDEDVLRAIRDGYVNTHYAMWRELDKWPRTASGLPSTAGTTASIAFIRKGKIYIGHVGDSGIILGYQPDGDPQWRAKALTKDHKPESGPEMIRIQESGGKVVSKSGVPRVVWNRPRIGHKGPVRRSTHIDEIPFLAVARSLGDLWSYNSELDTFIVSPEPDVKVVTVDVRSYRCLIFGTDGLWNMLTSQAAVAIVQAAEMHNEKHIIASQQTGNGQADVQMWINPSKSLVDRALERWSSTRLRADNTSVVTVMLDPPGPSRSEVLLSQKKELSSKSIIHHHQGVQPLDPTIFNENIEKPISDTAASSVLSHATPNDDSDISGLKQPDSSDEINENLDKSTKFESNSYVEKLILNVDTCDVDKILSTRETENKISNMEGIIQVAEISSSDISEEIEYMESKESKTSNKTENLNKLDSDEKIIQIETINKEKRVEDDEDDDDNNDDDDDDDDNNKDDGDSGGGGGDGDGDNDEEDENEHEEQEIIRNISVSVVEDRTTNFQLSHNIESKSKENDESKVSKTIRENVAFNETYEVPPLVINKFERPSAIIPSRKNTLKDVELLNVLSGSPRLSKKQHTLMSSNSIDEMRLSRRRHSLNLQSQNNFSDTLLLEPKSFMTVNSKFKSKSTRTLENNEETSRSSTMYSRTTNNNSIISTKRRHSTISSQSVTTVVSELEESLQEPCLKRRTRSEDRRGPPIDENNPANQTMEDPNSRLSWPITDSSINGRSSGGGGSSSTVSVQERRLSSPNTFQRRSLGKKATPTKSIRRSSINGSARLQQLRGIFGFRDWDQGRNNRSNGCNDRRLNRTTGIIGPLDSGIPQRWLRSDTMAATPVKTLRSRNVDITGHTISAQLVHHYGVVKQNRLSLPTKLKHSNNNGVLQSKRVRSASMSSNKFKQTGTSGTNVGTCSTMNSTSTGPNNGSGLAKWVKSLCNPSARSLSTRSRIKRLGK